MDLDNNVNIFSAMFDYNKQLMHSFVNYYAFIC